jgi:fatty-acyl-CoA synthase
MTLPLKKFKNIPSVWLHYAENFPRKTAVTHFVTGEEKFNWTYADLLNAAAGYSSFLKENGIKRSDVCAIIMHHNKNFYPLYLGICLLGGIPAVLAYPNARLHPDKFREGIEGMSQRSGLDWIITEQQLSSIIEPLIIKRSTTIKGIIYSEDDIEKGSLENINFDFNSFNKNDPFLLQHSSGTTGLQKPVLLSHSAVLNHIADYSDAIKLNESDKIISWLPLYHDMGLIAAFHLPLIAGIPFIQIDPFEWITIPALLPQLISSEKGTLSWLPNFAFNVLADKVNDEDLEGVSLSSWRMIINCSEPVRHESHLKFYEKYKPYGLNLRSISSSYAMAETTFAVTQSPPNEILKEVILDKNEFTVGRISLSDSGKVFVSSGKAIKGTEILIVDENRNPVPENHTGEIAVRSDSMFSGYRNYPEKTADVLSDGWYFTGDLGFVLDEYYYVTGRKKDLIIVAGNNIYPEDIEDAVGKVEGVIPGRVSAFGAYDKLSGSEQVNVIAETEHTDNPQLKMEIIKAGMKIDVTISKVFLVPPRWLIKSSAGKPGRSINKERILNQNIYDI